MKQYRYVVVSSLGASLDLSGGVQELQELLHRGWRPVRETAMGGGSNGRDIIAFALVLLERDKSDDEVPVAQPADEGTTREP